MIEFLVGYLLIGLGFSLALWLEQAEKKVSEGVKPDSFFGKTLFLFTLTWLFVAIYCYRAEVSKTIPKVDFDGIKKSTPQK